MKKQEIELRIETVGRRGDGVATLNGRPVFIPRTLAGELVRARLEGDRGEDGIAGRLLSVIEPNPERVAAPCPYYESCGGCALQHWEEAAYHQWKIERPLQLLDKAGLRPGIVYPPVLIAAGTRRRAVLAALRQGKALHLGYHRARSHDIVDIPDCMVLSPAVKRAAAAMRPYLATLLTDRRAAAVFIQDTGLALDVLITGSLGTEREPGLAEREAMAEMVQVCNIARLSWRRQEREAPEVMLQTRPVLKSMGGLMVELPSGAFMQPSAEGEAALVKAVIDPLRAGGTQQAIADLFAGCGTFAGPLLALGRVKAVESESAAVAALKKAAAGQAGLTAEARDLFNNPLTSAQLGSFDAVVFDPPRAGARAQAAELARSSVKSVVAVSCNPATFARDAEILVGGGYAFESLQSVDQFAWSAHLELVGVFRRR